MEDDDKPWANPNHPSYQGIQNKRCLGCGKSCHYSAWGPWCHPCNVERMTRINAALAPLAKALGVKL